MTLHPGRTLGPYEILSPLGAGGMGVVWRARDTRLDRTVAIKALPEGFARDPERLARFEREAKLLASLSHPNIAAIYGLEEAEGQRHLILEYVEGDTLSDRLRRGPMRIEDALDACRQIAAALESAHESGVIHRDLKPGNVKITPAGEIKVLDFGLAKGGTADTSAPSVLTQSPTLALGMTGAGVILGTAAYMSPEQARGRAVDRRTDIWSFGCVLYECLTGRMSFEGETVSDMIARILEREPDWSALPANTPARVRTLLERCLVKDAKQRLRDIGEARLELERALAERSSPAVRAPKDRGAPAPAAWKLAIAALAGVALGALGWAAIDRGGSRPAGEGPTHLSVTFPGDPEIREVQLARDGRRMVLRGVPLAESSQGKESVRLYVKELDTGRLREVPGSRGVDQYFLAVDGRWVYLVLPVNPGSSEFRVARAPIDGSAPPVALCNGRQEWAGGIALPDGGFLVVDDRIEHFTRVSSRGEIGPAEPIERGAFRGRIRRLQQVLPGGNAVLLDILVYLQKGWSVQSGVLDLRTRKLGILIEDGGNPHLTADGVLLFSRGDVLLATAFDAGRRVVRGAPLAVESGLRSQFTYTPGDYFVDRSGNLFTLPGGLLGDDRRLAIVGLDGKVTPLDAAPGPYQDYPTTSARGDVFAIKRTNGQGIDEVWFGSVARPALRRVVSWPDADAISIATSPSGTRIAYGRVGRDERDGLYVADSRTSGVGVRIVKPESASVTYRPQVWADEKTLLLGRIVTGAAPDLYVARVPDGDSLVTPRPLLVTPYEEWVTDVSSDGRWLAWNSNASGRNESYVGQLLPDGTLGNSIQITDWGAHVPEWIGDDRKLVVRDLGLRKVSIIDVGFPPAAGAHATREWFDLQEAGILDFMALPDGRGLAILKGEKERARIESCNVILGWSSSVKQRLAAGR